MASAHKKYVSMSNNNLNGGKASYGSQSPPNDSTDTVTYSVEEAIDSLGFGKFQFKIILIGAFVWISDAMEVMILSIFSPIARCEWYLQVWEEALISTIVFVGMLLGSPFEGKIIDMYGRKPGLVLLYFYLFFFGLLSAFSPSYGWILLLRGLVGFTLGGLAQTITIVAEFCSNQKRAAACTFVQCSWCIGTTLVVVGALFIIPPLGWRWFIGVMSIPAFLLTLVLYFFLPETPHFLLQIGKRDDAVKVLQQIARENGTKLPQGNLTDLHEHEKEERGTVSELFTLEFIRTTLLLIIIWFCIFVLYYGVVLFATQMLLHPESCSAEFDFSLFDANTCGCKTLTHDDYISIIYTSFAELPGGIFAMILADELGRKKSMGICCIIVSFLFFIMCSCPARTGMTALFFILRGLALGLTTVVFVLTSEVYPTKVRGVSIGFLNAFGRIGAMVTPFIAQVLRQESGRMSMVTYGFVAIACVIAILLLPKEAPRPKSWIRRYFSKSKE